VAALIVLAMGLSLNGCFLWDEGQVFYWASEAVDLPARRWIGMALVAGGIAIAFLSGRRCTACSLATGGGPALSQSACHSNRFGKS